MLPGIERLTWALVALVLVFSHTPNHWSDPMRGSAKGDCNGLPKPADGARPSQGA